MEPVTEPTSASTDIAVIGMAGRFPGAPTVDAFWSNLVRGVESVRFFSYDELVAAGVPSAVARHPRYVPARAVLDDAEMFDAAFFGYTPAEALAMDPQQRVFLECSWAALEDAGYDALRYREPIAVYAGANMSSHLFQLLADKERFDAYGGFQYATSNDKDYVATRVSYEMNLRGPSITVQTACSTSLVAIHLACQSLLSGESSMALAGGVGIPSRQINGYRYEEGGKGSPDGHCRAFDARAAGVVSGAGAGVVVLKSLHRALADRDQIYAVIKGSAVNNDGSQKMSFTAPSVDGQSSVVAEALAMADVSADRIGYVEGHGTGTPLGDPIEVAALTQVFREQTSRKAFCALASVKGNIGHLSAAAGVAGFIKASLALRHGVIPPSLHFERPNPDFGFEDGPFYVPTKATPWQRRGLPRCAGVSSLGIGGTNAHVVLEEAPPKRTAPASRAWQILLSSAKTSTALASSVRKLADALDNRPIAVADAAHTLALGRTFFPHRYAIVCRDSAEGVRTLRSENDADAMRAVAPERPRSVAFMFPGGGSQRTAMCAELYASEPVYRDTVDWCLDVLARDCDVDIRALLLDGAGDVEGEAPIERADIAHPALFVAEYAMAKLWMAWGVVPRAVVGHSMGEYAAACVAGVFAPEDALRLVVTRGRLMQRMPAGAMLVVPLSERDVTSRLTPSLSLAAVNAPTSCVVSGPVDAIVDLETRLASENVMARRLRFTRASHSAMMDAVLPEFREAVRNARPRPPRIPLASNLTGRWLSDGEATDPEYWVSHLRRPVRFSDGIALLTAEAECALLEIGPGHSLTKLARRQSGAAQSRLIEPSMSAPDDAASDREQLARTLAQCWVNGIEIDWERYRADDGGRRISLPSYPFERVRFSLDVAPPLVATAVNSSPRAESMTVTAMETATEPTRIARLNAGVGAVFASVFGYGAGELDDRTRTPLLQLGADSLVLMRASSALETKFGVTIPFRRFMGDLNCIAHIATYLDRELPPDCAPVAKEVAHAAEAPRNPERATTNIVAPVKATGSAIEQVVAQQLAIMARQLELLGGAAVEQQPSSVPQPKPVVAPVEQEAFGPFQPVRLSGAPEVTPEQKRNLDAFIADYTQHTRGSRAFAAQHRRVLADPRTTAGFRLLWKDMVYPIVGRRSRGSRLWDVDDNEYVDFTMGFGVHLFGHSPDFIVNALKRRIDDGVQLGPQTEQAGRVAAKISAMTGMERVAFCNSGTEAVMISIRLARAASGRPKVVVFSGSYHGMSDGVLARRRRTEGVIHTVPASIGVAAGAVEDIIVLDYGSAEALDEIRARAHEIAAVIVEPVQSRRPEFQPAEFLRELRTLTHECDVTLIFDEMITGFRVHQAGAQGYFGVKADLAAYGKVVGGGMPIGVVAGARDLIDRVDGGYWEYGDDSVPTVPQTAFAGTFSKHPLVMAAADAVLEELARAGPELQNTINKRTSDTVRRLEELFRTQDVELDVPCFGSLFRFRREPNAKWLDLIFQQMVRRGIYIWEARGCFLSTAHTDADVDALVAAAGESIDALRGMTFLPARPTSSRIPMTAPQRQVWRHAALGAGASLAYNEQAAIELRGQFDFAALRRVASMLTQRHEALRARVDVTGDALCIEPDIEPLVGLLDCSDEWSRVGDPLIPELVEREMTRPFELHAAPLWRVCVFRLDAEHHVLVVTFHHLIMDGLAAGVLLGELQEAYSAVVEGRVPNLPTAMQLSTFAQRASSGDAAQAKADSYWLRQLEGAHAGSLGASARRRMDTAPGARETMLLSPERRAAIATCAARAECTPYALLLSAFLALVHRVSGDPDITIGIPSLGRAFDGDERLIAHCVDLLTLRSRLAPDTTIREHVSRVQQHVLDATEHAACAYSRLAGELGKGNGRDGAPLIRMTFNLDPAGGPGGSRGFAGLRTTRVPSVPRHAKFDLHVNFASADNGYRLSCDYSTDILSATDVVRLMTQLDTMLAAMCAADSDAPLDSLSLCSVGERARALAEGNDSARPYDELSIAEVFEGQAMLTPNAIAVQCDDVRMSYGELDERANALATTLGALGLRAEARVGLYFERSIDSIVAMLGILKAGGTYVPLDPAYPRERLRYMLGDCGAALLVAQAGNHGAAAALAATCDYPMTVVTVDGAHVDRSGPLTSNERAHPDRLAYVMYTSGSTGQPKGVGVPHRAVVRLVRGTDYVQFRSDETVLQYAPLSFDASTFEIWGALLNGGRLVIAPPGVSSLHQLANVMRSCAVTTAWLTAGLFQQVVDDDVSALAGLRQLIAGGDALSVPHVERAMRALPHTHVVNGYGPTEATTFSVCHTVRTSDLECGVVPIGRPIANTTAYVLDEQMQPVALGNQGELYIGGLGLARGYVNAASLTAERFVPDPYGTTPGARLYRTGDLVRWRASDDNNAKHALEFLGRRDTQVKIRGFRVEPGDVEAALRSMSGVRDAAVVAALDPTGAKRLVAYVVSSRPPLSLRGELASRLPAHLLPGSVVAVETLPLTTNGKVDRRALATRAVSVADAYTAPSTSTEERLCEIWSEVLGLPRVSTSEHFVELGGDSLKAMRVLSRIRSAFDVDLGYDMLLDATIATLGEEIERVVADEIAALSDEDALRMLEAVS